MENGDACILTNKCEDQSRLVLGEVPPSSSRFNLSSSFIGDKYKATSAATNRWFHLARGASQRSTRRYNYSAGLTFGPSEARTAANRSRRLQRSTTSGIRIAESTQNCPQPSRCIDIGNAESPILHFRPQLWKHLDLDRDTINLDLFWPQNLACVGCGAVDEREDGEGEGKGEDKIGEMKSKERLLPRQGADIGSEEDDTDSELRMSNDIFPLKELKPLCQFRHLRYLRLGGMLQSYQLYIWQACWLNPNLEELVLEMALEPSMDDSYGHWSPIDRAWRRSSSDDACTQYLGQEDGTLSSTFGIGEYLDKCVIATARSAVAQQGVNLRYLPIAKLVLAGFVVDAGPFFRWFNPIRIRHIHFKYGCIDAGFALPLNTSDLVAVSWTNCLPESRNIVPVSKVDRQDVKVLTIEEEGSSSGTPTSTDGKAPTNFLRRNWTHQDRSANSSTKVWEDANYASGKAQTIGNAYQLDKRMIFDKMLEGSVAEQATLTGSGLERSI